MPFIPRICPADAFVFIRNAEQQVFFGDTVVSHDAVYMVADTVPRFSLFLF